MHVLSMHSESFNDDLVSQFSNLDKPDSVWVVCVSADSVKHQLTKICQSLWDLVPNFSQSISTFGGVRNNYQIPDSLGVDRWVAIVAAHQVCEKKPVILIDAGTAVTVDFVEGSGEYNGGVIFPGVITMRESLNQSAVNIEIVSNSHDSKKIELQNTNTQSAVEHGILLSIVGGIDRAISEYQISENKNAEVIITGGDARLVTNLSKYKMEVIPNLVLTGLLLLSEGSI